MISVTSDHGASAERLRTKKNVVNVIRTTKDFRIKTSIIKMIKWTGLQIRKDVKETLEVGAGMENDWIVNWMTSIIKMIKWTGLQIRKDVKETLEVGAGMENDWIVNWMTDGEAKQKSARNPTYHLDSA